MKAETSRHRTCRDRLERVLDPHAVQLLLKFCDMLGFVTNMQRSNLITGDAFGLDPVECGGPTVSQWGLSIRRVGSGLGSRCCSVLCIYTEIHGTV